MVACLNFSDQGAEAPSSCILKRAPLFMSANAVNGVESDKRSPRQPAAASGDAGLSSDYVTARETITRQVSTQSKGQYWTPDESPGKSSQGDQDSFISTSVHTFTFYSLLAACFMTVLVYFYMVFNSSSSSPQAAHVALWSENDTKCGAPCVRDILNYYRSKFVRKIVYC
ncbi:hypothetical protein MTO96_034171 [Rhipicephalus appendiculatus]